MLLNIFVETYIFSGFLWWIERTVFIYSHFQSTMYPWWIKVLISLKKKFFTDPKHILFSVYYMERRNGFFFMIPNTICSLNWYVVLELTLHHVICVSVWHVGVAVLICCHGIVPGEWCKPAQCNPWAGCCCTEEGWTDGDHYCPVQTRR